MLYWRSGMDYEEMEAAVMITNYLRKYLKALEHWKRTSRHNFKQDAHTHNHSRVPPQTKRLGTGSWQIWSKSEYLFCCEMITFLWYIYFSMKSWVKGQLMGMVHQFTKFSAFLALFGVGYSAFSNYELATLTTTTQPVAEEEQWGEGVFALLLSSTLLFAHVSNARFSVLVWE